MLVRTTERQGELGYNLLFIGEGKGLGMGEADEQSWQFGLNGAAAPGRILDRRYRYRYRKIGRPMAYPAKPPAMAHET